MFQRRRIRIALLWIQSQAQSAIREDVEVRIGDRAAPGACDIRRSINERESRALNPRTAPPHHGLPRDCPADRIGEPVEVHPPILFQGIPHAANGIDHVVWKEPHVQASDRTSVSEQRNVPQPMMTPQAVEGSKRNDASLTVGSQDDACLTVTLGITMHQCVDTGAEFRYGASRIRGR